MASAADLLAVQDLGEETLRLLQRLAGEGLLDGALGVDRDPEECQECWERQFLDDEDTYDADGLAEAYRIGFNKARANPNEPMPSRTEIMGDLQDVEAAG